ncbi:MAG: hypothetical protein H6731_02780 [Myxococcales bacterium]|nr:MAG: hypothetical protein H6731_02780 [Myxococcales bacterium]
MPEKKSFLSDARLVFFSSRRFLEERFLLLPAKRIFALAFLGVFLGLGLGGLINYAISLAVEHDFLDRVEMYHSALAALGLDKDSFIEMLKLQRSYSFLLAVLSPVIAYMAPHIFGGALFIFLRLLVRLPEIKIDFFHTMECASVALCSMIFYAIPFIGPLLAVTLVVLNLSRALFKQYKMTGFMKGMSIFSALYLCFFIPAATLQVLAQNMVHLFK